ncbi:transposable element Tcb2 transposase [Trichonephila clavipes]|nr:transposable element Tcb2 transposase [Trichonephila clavipes]
MSTKKSGNCRLGASVAIYSKRFSRGISSISSMNRGDEPSLFINMSSGRKQLKTRSVSALSPTLLQFDKCWMAFRLSDRTQMDVGSILGSIPIRRFCVQKTCSRPTTSYNTCRRPFSALSARRRRTTTVPQLVADHFQASGRRISGTTVRNRLHNAGLYARRPVVCVSLNGRQRRNCLCWAREHVSWTQQQWASVLFTDESRFTMESDSGRLLIWREQRIRYHQSKTVERHSYRGGGILVWAGISLGGHTDLHVFHGGTVTGLRYRDEILDPYVRPYAAAIGNDFILMDDNARDLTEL